MDVLSWLTAADTVRSTSSKRLGVMTRREDQRTSEDIRGVGADIRSGLSGNQKTYSVNCSCEVAPILPDALTTSSPALPMIRSGGIRLIIKAPVSIAIQLKENSIC